MLDTIPRRAPATAALTYLYLPTDPRAEGARARAAGLAAEDNPYLWPPGARGEWTAGFEGETK